MVAVAAQLDFVCRLFAVIAAILAVLSPGFDRAAAGGVGAFDRTGHIAPPRRLYAPAAVATSSASLVKLVYKIPQT